MLYAAIALSMMKLILHYFTCVKNILFSLVSHESDHSDDNVEQMSKKKEKHSATKLSELQREKVCWKKTRNDRF